MGGTHGPGQVQTLSVTAKTEKHRAPGGRGHEASPQKEERRRETTRSPGSQMQHSFPTFPVS